MTEQDERQAKALALLEHQEAQARLSLRREAAKNLSLELRSLADLLVTNPTNIAVEAYEGTLTYARLSGVVSDVKTAEDEWFRAADRMTTLNKL
jgi:hypothetical protein